MGEVASGDGGDAWGWLDSGAVGRDATLLLCGRDSGDGACGEWAVDSFGIKADLGDVWAETVGVE
jgi:hypothetical protein